MEINTQQKPAASDVTVEHQGNSVFVIAYAAMAFSGFLMGLLAGWAIWAG